MDWRTFLDRLGLNGTWWQWRIYRWQQRWEQWRAGARDAGRTIAYAHKLCDACGGLVDRDDQRCPRCGASVSSYRWAQAKRAVRVALPSHLPTTTILLAANIAVQLLLMALFGGAQLFQPDGVALYRMGELHPELVLNGQYWRLITYGYLHIGLLHIGFNLLSLSQVGPVLESQVGRRRFFCLYTLAMLGGGLADVVFQRTVAGASGALFGLIGFGIAYAHGYGGEQGRAQRNFFLQWAFYGFLYGVLVPRVDNICHAGGFLVGLALGFLLEREQRRGEGFETFWNAATAALALATLAAFGALAAWNLR